MPITRKTNRQRPKNKRNQSERGATHAAQTRWLVNGSEATHEERLGLTTNDDAAAPKAAAQTSE